MRQFGAAVTERGVFIRLGDIAGEVERDLAVRFARTVLDVAGEPTDAVLRERARRQAADIRQMQLVLERKNRALDAMHYVWCDGGCARGVHRWTNTLVTREIVEAAERNAQRLRRWYRTVEFRAKLPGGDSWQRRHYARAAAKTDLAP